jgi:hypothetical protein
MAWFLVVDVYQVASHEPCSACMSIVWTMSDGYLLCP